MGTAVVGLLLIIVVSQVIRSMIRDKKNGKSPSMRMRLQAL